MQLYLMQIKTLIDAGRSWQSKLLTNKELFTQLQQTVQNKHPQFAILLQCPLKNPVTRRFIQQTSVQSLLS